MYALDTNILVYAHNVKSPHHASAKAFVEQVMSLLSSVTMRKKIFDEVLQKDMR
jgi:predicted nucleic acid-binding protein